MSHPKGMEGFPFCMTQRVRVAPISWMGLFA